MAVTLFGMMTAVREEQSENAYFPSVVIPSETTSFLISSLDENHGYEIESIIFPLPVRHISPVPLSNDHLMESSVPDVNEGQSENA